jgi:menaquinone-specific isochorismate synthase
MTPIWVDEEGALVGHPPYARIDPGAGPGRYEAALAALRASGRAIAFASFTFDETEPASLVVLPSTTTLEKGAGRSNSRNPPRLVDDGIARWREGFRAAMAAVAAGRVEKVVLARQVVVELPTEIDHTEILARLETDNPGCYLFSVAGLIGASPELLVSLRDGRLKTLALAGTAIDPDELESVKMSEEHRHVADSVRTVLGRHLARIDLTEQVTVPHGLMSHIGTRVEGVALPGTTVADILGDLHPTAAVGGTPTAAALEVIREVEPRSRGRYAGPVGWMNTSGDGVFALALRCGQIEGSLMTLFAGGGLVDGSEEEAELDETELKLAPMLTALGQPTS